MNTHTFNFESSPPTPQDFLLSFYSSQSFTLRQEKNVRENFSSPWVWLLLFNSSTFFLLIIRIYLKIKSRICIKETHWNNDNRPFEKDWTYAWIEVMWVNKIWVLSLLFIKMALSSACSRRKRAFLFSWVFSLYFCDEEKEKNLLTRAFCFKRSNNFDGKGQANILVVCLKALFNNHKIIELSSEDLKLKNYKKTVKLFNQFIRFFSHF